MPHHNPQGDRNDTKVRFDGVHKKFSVLGLITTDMGPWGTPAESEFDNHFSGRARTLTI